MFCCGHAAFSQAQKLLSMGNLSDNGTTLPEIVKLMQKNVLYWWLYLKGPMAIMKELGFERKVYNKCEFCLYLSTVHWEKLLSLSERKEEIFSSWNKQIG